MAVPFSGKFPVPAVTHMSESTGRQLRKSPRSNKQQFSKGTSLADIEGMEESSANDRLQRRRAQAASPTASRSRIGRCPQRRCLEDASGKSQGKRKGEANE